jgi:hypothetical protein
MTLELLARRDDVAESKTRFFKPMAFFWLFRPNRTAMVAMITGTAAFTAGAGLVRSLWMTLAGWCLAVEGRNHGEAIAIHQNLYRACHNPCHIGSH